MCCRANAAEEAECKAELASLKQARRRAGENEAADKQEQVALDKQVGVAFIFLLQGARGQKRRGGPMVCTPAILASNCKRCLHAGHLTAYDNSLHATRYHRAFNWSSLASTCPFWRVFNTTTCDSKQEQKLGHFYLLLP